MEAGAAYVDEQVWIKSYVDIEGAGELATRITYGGSSSPDAGTIKGGRARSCAS